MNEFVELTDVWLNKSRTRKKVQPESFKSDPIVGITFLDALLRIVADRLFVLRRDQVRRIRLALPAGFASPSRLKF